MRLAEGLTELRRLGGYGDVQITGNGVCTLRIRAKFELRPGESHDAFVERVERAVRPGDDVQLVMIDYRPHAVLIRELKEA
jgi:hypothetical protein